jgi:hypothetical protein
MNIAMPTGLGAIIAIVVLIVVIILSIIGQMPGGPIIACLLGALALARLT